MRVFNEHGGNVLSHSGWVSGLALVRPRISRVQGIFDLKCPVIVCKIETNLLIFLAILTTHKFAAAFFCYTVARKASGFLSLYKRASKLRSEMRVTHRVGHSVQPRAVQGAAPRSSPTRSLVPGCRPRGTWASLSLQTCGTASRDWRALAVELSQTKHSHDQSQLKLARQASNNTTDIAWSIA